MTPPTAAQRPSPPDQRDQLVKAINMIDEANARVGGVWVAA